MIELASSIFLEATLLSLPRTYKGTSRREREDTTDTARSASYLSIHLEFHNEGRLRAKLYHKREDFSIMNFPFIFSNIPVAPHLHMAVDPIFQSLWFLSWCPRMLRKYFYIWRRQTEYIRDHL
jgi:hypothetical protein